MSGAAVSLDAAHRNAPDAVHALRLENVSRRFGAVHAVQPMSLSVQAGERRALLGANGAGKTTLFNVIAGDLPPSTGSVLMFGEDVTRLSTHRRVRLGMRRTYQTSLVFAGLTVRECLFLAVTGIGAGRFLLSRATRRPEMDAADQLAEQVGLQAMRHFKAGELSHGEARQLELGMATAGKPRLLLLDEPAAGLSLVERHRLLGLLRDLPRSLTLVMIEHDMEVALQAVDRVTVMHNGAIVAEGTPQEVTADTRVHDIYMGKHGN
jgi:branched-chain amino acid transport system ATP-binding protein